MGLGCVYHSTYHTCSFTKWVINFRTCVLLKYSLRCYVKQEMFTGCWSHSCFIIKVNVLEVFRPLFSFSDKPYRNAAANAVLCHVATTNILNKLGYVGVSVPAAPLCALGGAWKEQRRIVFKFSLDEQSFITSLNKVRKISNLTWLFLGVFPFFCPFRV